MQEGQGGQEWFHQNSEGSAGLTLHTTKQIYVSCNDELHLMC